MKKIMFKKIAMTGALLVALSVTASAQKLLWSYDLTPYKSSIVIQSFQNDGKGGCALTVQEKKAGTNPHVLWFDKKGKLLLDKTDLTQSDYRIMKISPSGLICAKNDGSNDGKLLLIDKMGNETSLNVSCLSLNYPDAVSVDSRQFDATGYFAVETDESGLIITALKRFTLK